MSALCILICRRDDPASATLTELASFDLPGPDLAALTPATTLDDLEATTLTTGMAVLRRVFQLAWEQLDAALVAQYRAAHPTRRLPADGVLPLTVVSRFGSVPLRRQMLTDRAQHTHVIPGNAVLPEHGGVLTTRGLQEWACLLPQELPFSSVARLLGWQTQEPDVLSDTTVRTLVKRHGQLLRQAEQEESAALLEGQAEAHLQPVVVPRERPRWRAGWPAGLNAAVEAALAREQVRPPEGVSWADWERVLAARRAEQELPVEDLRHLGPRLREGEVLLTVDEVLTPKTDGTGRWELRTAVLATAEGERYVSGTGPAFLPVVEALARVAVGEDRPVAAAQRRGALDPHLLHGAAEHAAGSPAPVGLVSSGTKVSRSGEPDLPGQGGQEDLPAAGVPAVVGRAGGRGGALAGGVSAAGAQPSGAGRADRLPAGTGGVDPELPGAAAGTAVHRERARGEGERPAGGAAAEAQGDGLEPGQQ